VVHDGGRPALGQGLVDGVRAAGVGVAFDLEAPATPAGREAVEE
jgi:hypothetical protein